ncbi:beta-galactosidase [Saccharibacillus sp. CPCC 101409]|nr:beta-galactosidase [Saccharibacillus sp. CPCC 101409]MDO3408324.1 beta-galactosidase [Saccharibacillus sp. CPCC 101409]
MGVCYYPEHWDEALWEKDAAKMAETGVKVVRVGEFAWSRMEPTDGVFEFDWLDRAIDLFGRYGLDVVIGTPTHTPPRWLTTKHPDILPVMANGDLYQPGVRGHRCFNSRSLRSYGERLIDRLAQRYSRHPAVIGWQIDNEYGMLDSRGEQAAADFRDWLYRKYGTLERLNREWGTVVWSGEYSEWSEIVPPPASHRNENPSFLLDFARFQWDSVAQFQAWQIAAIRRHCPEHFITHNFHSYPQRLNMTEVGRGLDVAAFDYYPNTSPDKVTTGPYSGALSLDLTRGIKRRNFWIMEQLSGSPGSWFPMWRMPQPGYIRAFAWQAIARGADTVVHFRWRSANIGAEQFWHGLIDHSNVPGRRLKEFADLSAEVNRLAPKLAGTRPLVRAAILHSYEQLEALRIQAQAPGMDYYENIKAYHRALTKLGIGCDVIDAESADGLEAYDLVVAPHLYVLHEETAERLSRYAASGGTLLLTSRTGVKNSENVCVMTPLPGLLTECAGVTVREYDPLGEDVARLDTEEGGQFACSQWADILEPDDRAEVIARYGSEFFAGEAAVTRYPFGQGETYYLGTHPEESYLRQLFTQIAEAKNIPYFPELPMGVQVSLRGGGASGEPAYLFVLNLSREDKEVKLDLRADGRLRHLDGLNSLLGGGRTDRRLKLRPYGVEVLEYRPD